MFPFTASQHSSRRPTKTPSYKGQTKRLLRLYNLISQYIFFSEAELIHVSHLSGDTPNQPGEDTGTQKGLMSHTKSKARNVKAQISTCMWLFTKLRWPTASKLNSIWNNWLPPVASQNLNLLFLLINLSPFL